MEQHEQADTAGDQDRAQELRAFGMVLQQLRKRRKLTQEQLAWEMQMEQNYISLLERGEKEPGVRTLLKLSRALGVSSGQFMNEVEATIETLKTSVR